MEPPGGGSGPPPEPPRRPKRRSPSIPKGTGPEAERARRRLAGFDYENSTAWKGLCDRFGAKITTNTLRSAAHLICSKVPEIPRPDREAQRSGSVLVKWYDENWALIEPRLGCLAFRDEGDRAGAGEADEGN
jgi:hypothetical protein